LRAAPARAKPPVNFALDREEKASKERKPQQKMRKKTSNSQSVQKKDKNAQSTAKKDILRKTNRQAEAPPPIYNAEMLKKNKTQQTTFNGRKKYKNGHQQ